MASRTARFISTIFASIIAGAPLATISSGAAEDCLSAPSGVSPQGQHWFYRLEKDTKRKCWYLRAAGDKVAAPHSKVAAAPAPKPEPTHSVQDAHAELTAAPVASPPVKATISPPPSPPALVAPAAQPPAQVFPAVAANPEQQADTSAPAIETVDASPSVTVSSASGDARRKRLLSASSVAAPSANADPAPQRPTGSLQTLLLVMVGALGLAGLIASVVYRLGWIARPRLDANDGARRINWDTATDAGGPPWRDETRPMISTAGPAEWPREADLDDFTSEPEQAFAEPAPRAHSEVDVDRITAMLERLVQQGPQLDAPSAAAGFADRGRTRLGRPAVRA